MPSLASRILISTAVVGALLSAPSNAVAQMRPGEPPKGALKSGQCVTIKVEKSDCPSGKMRVCSGESLSQGTRKRTCVR